MNFPDMVEESPENGLPKIALLQHVVVPVVMPCPVRPREWTMTKGRVHGICCFEGKLW